jgi:hypothetical protein
LIFIASSSVIIHSSSAFASSLEVQSAYFALSHNSSIREFTIFQLLSIMPLFTLSIHLFPLVACGNLLSAFLRASSLVRSFAFTGVFGIIGGITFSHGTFGNIFGCTHWVLNKGVTPDNQGFCCVAVVSGCVHTLLLIACCALCVATLLYHSFDCLIISASAIFEIGIVPLLDTISHFTFFTDNGFPLGGGNSFNSSLNVLACFILSLPFFNASIAFLPSGESLLR